VSVDPKSLVSIIGIESGPVRVSELDALCAREGARLGDAIRAEDITSGLAAAIRNGWIHTDGLRVFVSGSGRRVLGH
jgi:hypothetical protein